MSWTYRLSKEAAKQLRRLPRDRQEQLGHAIDQMSENPLRGDVSRISSGTYRGALRRRVGRYRIIFSLDLQDRLIEIAAILHRSESTYR